MLKPILRVSFASLWYRKRTTLFTLMGIFLAVILIVVTTVFSVAMLDLMLNIGFFDIGTPIDSIPTAADIAQIKAGDDSYTMMFVIVALLMALAVLAAVSAISSVLTAGAGEKTKTLSVLSTLGASKGQASILLITDALALSVIAISLGLAAGVLASIPMLSYLDHTTYAKFGMPHYVDTVTNSRAGYLALTALLALLGIADKEFHYPNQLSGGQQQRVAIARACITKPAILLADEPTGNLDSKNSAEIMDLLTAANRELGQTIIMVTHDMAVARRADRIIEVADGTIISDRLVQA